MDHFKKVHNEPQNSLESRASCSRDSSLEWGIDAIIFLWFFLLLEFILVRRLQGGFLFLACNYNICNYTTPFQFYYELLSWWSEFRQTFATEKDWTNTIWNNCEIRIDNEPVHYKNYYEPGILFTQVLSFNLIVADAHNHLSNKEGP